MNYEIETDKQARKCTANFLNCDTDFEERVKSFKPYIQ